MTAGELAALLSFHPDATVFIDGCCGGGCANEATGLSVDEDGRTVEIRHAGSVLPLPGDATRPKASTHRTT